MSRIAPFLRNLTIILLLLKSLIYPSTLYAESDCSAIIPKLQKLAEGYHHRGVFLTAWCGYPEGRRCLLGNGENDPKIRSNFDYSVLDPTKYPYEIIDDDCKIAHMQSSIGMLPSGEYKQHVFHPSMWDWGANQYAVKYYEPFSFIYRHLISIVSTGWGALPILFIGFIFFWLIRLGHRLNGSSDRTWGWQLKMTGLLLLLLIAMTPAGLHVQLQDAELASYNKELKANAIPGTVYFKPIKRRDYSDFSDWYYYLGALAVPAVVVLLGGFAWMLRKHFTEFMDAVFYYTVPHRREKMVKEVIKKDLTFKGRLERLKSPFEMPGHFSRWRARNEDRKRQKHQTLMDEDSAWRKGEIEMLQAAKKRERIRDHEQQLREHVENLNREEEEKKEAVS